jgi:hypothetical protein
MQSDRRPGLTIEWKDLVAVPAILSLLERMQERGDSAIEPFVDEKGQVAYSLGEGWSGVNTGELLEYLLKAGVLEKKSEGKLLGCPVHEGAVDLAPRVRCPYCSSMQLRKGALFQHVCGYMGAPELYLRGCPQCKKAAPPQTLKSVGTWYECEACHKRSAQPNVFLYCKRYGHDFAIGLAKLVDQAVYKLTPEAAGQLRGRLGVVISVLKGLREANAEVEPSGRLTGESGVEHDFDLLIDSGGRKVPVDVKAADSGPVDVVAVLSTYAKALDTKVVPTILVAIPEASEDAKKTASAYGMVLIEGRDPKVIAQKILESLVRPSVST